jgi:hypothetical protein
MPIRSSIDEPLDYVAISGPVVDKLDDRLESTSNPKIAAQDLRRNFDEVGNALFADIRALIESTAQRLTMRDRERR